MGRETDIRSYCVVSSPEKLSIGKRSSIAEFVHMWAGGGIIIGDNVMIASHSVITSITHDTSAEIFRDSIEIAPVIIKNNVWIGAGVIILPGVHIGSGSIVGAGAVVTRDVPENVVVMGVPARIIRHVERESGSNNGIS